MKKILISGTVSIFLLLTLFSGLSYGAINRFVENYSAIPSTSLSFPMNHSNRFIVNSSWTEPRSSETHPGIDSAGTTTNDVYPIADNAVVFEKGSDGATTGRGNFLVLKYTIGGVTVYSNYFHLSSYATGVTEGSTITSKTTPVAKVGNTGASAGAHLHWEILSSYTKGSSSSRLSINPKNFDWGSTAFSIDAPVFKNFNYNSSTKVVTIVAYDSDSGSSGGKASVSPKILHKTNSGSSWTQSTMNPITSTTDPYDYSYTLSYFSTAVDLIITGRRTSLEYWSYYPAKYANDHKNTNPLPTSTDSKVTVFAP